MIQPEPMTSSCSLTLLHQWFLAETKDRSSARTIILHGESAKIEEDLIDEIAAYLNEYDDDEAGNWLAVKSELVQQIAEDADLRSLLGMVDTCPNCPPTSDCGIRKTYQAFGERGHVIFHAVSPPGKPLELSEAFHAGIGNQSTISVKCHVVLDPDLMETKSIAPIIGDVFLEWLQGDRHRSLHS
jgi:hypothetical protein